MEPTDATRAEAKKFPGGYVYAIEGAYEPRGAVPPDAIAGAWKVDDNGQIVGDFIPNPNYRSGSQPREADELVDHELEKSLGVVEPRKHGSPRPSVRLSSRAAAESYAALALAAAPIAVWLYWPPPLHARFPLWLATGTLSLLFAISGARRGGAAARLAAWFALMLLAVQTLFLFGLLLGWWVQPR